MVVNSKRDVNVLVYILVILFGMGSWIETNGVWVELPVLVHEAPEGWSLPSYVTVVCQLGNIGPIAFTLLHKYSHGRVTEVHGAYTIIIIGVVACVLLLFCWDITAYVAGSERSVGLLASLLLLVITDCTSSVVFLPYMSVFKPAYMTALYIGEGLSGMLPALLALGQNVGQTLCVNKTINITNNETEIVPDYIYPNFPVEYFFSFLLAMLITCGIAFTLLQNLPYCRQEHVRKSVLGSLYPQSFQLRTFRAATNKANHGTKYDRGVVENAVYHSANEQVIDLSHKGAPNLTPLTHRQYIYLLFIVGYVNAMSNGVIMSVYSFATLPYGDTTFHTSTTIMNIVSPCVCAITFFMPVASPGALSGLVVLGSALSSYILLSAAYSPLPPLLGTVIGEVLIVTDVVVFVGCMAFVKVSIATIFREKSRDALLWCGVVTQIGSALGSILMFILINVLQLFNAKYPCT